MQYEEEARRTQVWARAFFMGPTGSGKSLGALLIASQIFGGEIPVTLINTERGRARLYADRFKFGLIDMSEDGDYNPGTFIKAIDLAERNEPGGTIVLDSSSHEWMGRGGILQMADRFGDWKTVRPMHTEFVDRLLAIEGHLIVTCRAKMKYLVGEETVPGREKPRQTVNMLGVGPIQDGDFQYEFNLVGQFEQATHECTFSGHADPLVDTVCNLKEEVEAVSEKFTRWLSEGDAPEPALEADPKAVENLRGLLVEAGVPEDDIEKGFDVMRRMNRGKLHPDTVAAKTESALERVEAKRAPEPEAEAAPEPPAAAPDGDAAADAERAEDDRQEEAAAAGATEPK